MANDYLHKKFLAAALFFFTLLIPCTSTATSEFAVKTGLECSRCHLTPAGGSGLTITGKEYFAKIKAEGIYRPGSAARRIATVFMGYLHLMASIVWFGTIMYVHILLKPAYASKGLPKGELRLGWLSMIVVLITGVYLTVVKVHTWETFYTTQYGALLGLKILLFMTMLTSAVIVTIYIGPMLRKQRSQGVMKISHDITLEQLSHFDGREGRPAYIAYRGVIYDLTQSRLWKNGSHVTKHNAGNDLTEILKTAPHGEDKVIGMPQVGRLVVSGEKTSRPFHIRLFFFFAYMNLVLVFIITLIIAVWRWW